MLPTSTDIALLIRDKYGGSNAADITSDLVRLAHGEPLAYVIGWIPFLSLSIRLDSQPLIPRPETEWWTETLIAHINERFGTGRCTVLDLCAGSGAIGLAVLSECPSAHVSFGELSPLHTALIGMNADENKLDTSRSTIRSGDLFTPFAGEKFDIIATNPPYIPSDRALEESVSGFEPSEALYSGLEGLDTIERIVSDAPEHLAPGGELWMECDVSNIERAATLMKERGFENVEIRTDLYSRPRIVVGYFL